MIHNALYPYTLSLLQGMGSESLFDFVNILIIAQIHLFVFHAPPEPFNKNIIINPSPTIHADWRKSTLVNDPVFGEYYTKFLFYL